MAKSVTKKTQPVKKNSVMKPKFTKPKASKPIKKKTQAKSVVDEGQLSHDMSSMTNAKTSRKQKKDASPAALKKKSDYSMLLESLNSFLTTDETLLTVKQRQTCEKLIQDLGLIDPKERKKRTEECVKIAYAVGAAVIRGKVPAYYQLFGDTTVVAAKPYYRKLVP